MKKPECFDDYNNADSMRVLTDDEISACEEYAKHTMKPFVLNTTRSIQFNKEYVISELIKILSGIIKDPYGCPIYTKPLAESGDAVAFAEWISEKVEAHYFVNGQAQYVLSDEPDLFTTQQLYSLFKESK